MTLNVGVGLELINRAKLLRQSHLIVMVVNTVMTETTDENPLVEFSLRIVFFEPSPTVKFLRNQVMEGQCHGTSAKGTVADSIRNHNQVFSNIVS